MKHGTVQSPLSSFLHIKSQKMILNHTKKLSYIRKPLDEHKPSKAMLSLSGPESLDALPNIYKLCAWALVQVLRWLSTLLYNE